MKNIQIAMALSLYFSTWIHVFHDEVHMFPT